MIEDLGFYCRDGIDMTAAGSEIPPGCTESVYVGRANIQVRPPHVYILH